MPSPQESTRRLELCLLRPLLTLYAGVRPTVVIGERAQPAQWGTGSWQISADAPVPIGVFLFNRVWRFGEADHLLQPGDALSLVYVAPVLPFLRGSFRIAPATARSPRSTRG